MSSVKAVGESFDQWTAIQQRRK